MAFYYLKIYNARDNHEAEAKGTKGKERTGSPVFEWASTTDTDQATAITAAMSAIKQHSLFRNMDITEDILDSGWDSYSNASLGPWSMRYGKHVYAYKLGSNNASAALAKTLSAYKNLS